jgi:hypothetical protein
MRSSERDQNVQREMKTMNPANIQLVPLKIQLDAFSIPVLRAWIRLFLSSFVRSGQ